MIVLAESDTGFQSRVEAALGRRPDLVAVAGLEDLVRLLAQGGVTVALVGPSMSIATALQLAEEMRVSYPQVSVVLVASNLTSDLLQAALRAGVRDILPTSCTEEQLADAVQRAETLAKEFASMRGGGGTGGDGEEPAPQGRVITVFSSKGGVGKSFVASNLAVLLARQHGQPVALVDLDLQFGDLAIMLHLFPGRTMADAAQSLDRLDEDSLRGFLTPHRSKVMLLAAPPEPGLAETISGEAVQQILGLLRRSFPVVVIDTPAALNDHVLAALDEGDECIVVTSLEVPSIKNVKIALQTLELLGMDRDNVKLLLNRADTQVGLPLREVERTLGTRVDVQVPSSRDVPLSINQGSPLALDNPKSPVVEALARIIDSGTAPRARRQGRPKRRIRIGRRTS